MGIPAPPRGGGAACDGLLGCVKEPRSIPRIGLRCARQPGRGPGGPLCFLTSRRCRRDFLLASLARPPPFLLTMQQCTGIEEVWGGGVSRCSDSAVRSPRGQNTIHAVRAQLHVLHPDLNPKPALYSANTLRSHTQTISPTFTPLWTRIGYGDSSEFSQGE